MTIKTASPGALFGKGCAISADRLVARLPDRRRAGRRSLPTPTCSTRQDLGDGAEHNLDAILSELSELQH